jgi:transposase
MAKACLPDNLWAKIGRLLPPEPVKAKGGCPRTPDRTALTGISFVLRSGTPSQSIPRQIGCARV